MKKRTVTIMGGGHGARTMAADLTLAGHRVTLFEFKEFHGNVAEIFKNQTINISGKERQGSA